MHIVSLIHTTSYHRLLAAAAARFAIILIILILTQCHSFLFATDTNNLLFYCTASTIPAYMWLHVALRWAAAPRPTYFHYLLHVVCGVCSRVWLLLLRDPLIFTIYSMLYQMFCSVWLLLLRPSFSVFVPCCDLFYLSYPWAGTHPNR